MSYHTILKTSQDYTAALKSAREIAKNISRATGANVFPYRLIIVRVFESWTVLVFVFFFLCSCQCICVRVRVVVSFSFAGLSLISFPLFFSLSASFTSITSSIWLSSTIPGTIFYTVWVCGLNIFGSLVWYSKRVKFTFGSGHWWGGRPCVVII